VCPCGLGNHGRSRRSIAALRVHGQRGTVAPWRPPTCPAPQRDPYMLVAGGPGSVGLCALDGADGCRSPGRTMRPATLARAGPCRPRNRIPATNGAQSGVADRGGQPGRALCAETCLPADLGGARRRPPCFGRVRTPDAGNESDVDEDPLISPRQQIDPLATTRPDAPAIPTRGLAGHDRR